MVAKSSRVYFNEAQKSRDPLSSCQLRNASEGTSTKTQQRRFPTKKSLRHERPAIHRNCLLRIKQRRGGKTVCISLLICQGDTRAHNGACWILKNSATARRSSVAASPLACVVALRLLPLLMKHNLRRNLSNRRKSQENENEANFTNRHYPHVLRSLPPRLLMLSAGAAFSKTIDSAKARKTATKFSLCA